MYQKGEEELADVADMVEVAEFGPETAIVTEGGPSLGNSNPHHNVIHGMPQRLLDTAAGETGEAMFFLAGGEARALLKETVVRSYDRGEFFGELALLMDQPRKATVRSGPEGATCLTLDRDTFDMFADQNTTVFAERQRAYASVRQYLCFVYTCRRFKMMDFVFKLMDFVFKLMDFVLKMMDFVFKLMDFVLTMMDFAFKLMDFVLTMMI